MQEDTVPTTTASHTFGQGPGGTNLFAVLPGLPLKQTLEQASCLFSAAMVLSAETADANVQVCRALNRAILQLVEVGTGLVDACVEGVTEHA